MLTRKIWDHTIEVKKKFVLRKGKVYPLSREEREEVREFIREQCYELKYLELDKRTNSCIRVNIRELDKELFTK